MDKAEDYLPPPAIASNSHNNIPKKTTFDNGVRVHWARFKKTIGTGSVPSESLIEGESTTESTSRYGHGYTHCVNPNMTTAEDDEEVDEIVVDNTFVMDENKSATQGSEFGGGMVSPERSGTGTHMTPGTDRGSFTQESEGFIERNFILSSIRYRLWPLFHHFFFNKFHDPSVELHYQKEVYYQTMGLKFWGSIFIILNWVLLCILLKQGTVWFLSPALPFFSDALFKPYFIETISMPDRVFYYAVSYILYRENYLSITIPKFSPVLCVPLPIFVMFDWPKLRPMVWQIYLLLSVWSWANYRKLLTLTAHDSPVLISMICYIFRAYNASALRYLQRIRAGIELSK